jgi:hypothetical protein
MRLEKVKKEDRKSAWYIKADAYGNLYLQTTKEKENDLFCKPKAENSMSQQWRIASVSGGKYV